MDLQRQLLGFGVGNAGGLRVRLTGEGFGELAGGLRVRPTGDGRTKVRPTGSQYWSVVHNYNLQNKGLARQHFHFCIAGIYSSSMYCFIILSLEKFGITERIDS